MKFIFLSIFLSLSSLAQHSAQPEKESNSDLRNETVLFSIQDISTGKTYQLERYANLSHYLRLVHKGDDVIQKIDGRVAGKLDQDFAGRFLRCQYELPDVPGKCEVTLRLTMKSEEQEICLKDDKKTQEIKAFVQDLTSRF